MFGPAMSEEYSPVVLAGGRLTEAYPLVVVESDTARVSDLPMVESDTARASVLPVAGCKFPAVFLGKVAVCGWMWLVWVLARHVSEWIRRKPC